jgi:hypothetical protein
MTHSPSNPQPCPDCGGTLVAIKLFARGPKSLAGIAIDTESFLFTGMDASRDGWSGKFPEMGEVQAHLCTGCHRIFLYGEPVDEKAARPNTDRQV